MTICTYSTKLLGKTRDQILVLGTIQARIKRDDNSTDIRTVDWNPDDSLYTPQKSPAASLEVVVGSVMYTLLP
jgi:hypothetical protein